MTQSQECTHTTSRQEQRDFHTLSGGSFRLRIPLPSPHWRSGGWHSNLWLHVALMHVLCV